MVEGGLDDTAYVTQVTPSISFVILLLISRIKSYGNLVQFAVIASVESTTLIITIWPYIRSSPSTPTAISSPTAAYACQTLSYNPADISSSSTILLACFAIFTFSGVTSPIILTASPGPGKGCRFSKIAGTSNNFATLLTSSLYRLLSGSIILKLRSFGRPPTL